MTETIAFYADNKHGAQLMHSYREFGDNAEFQRLLEVSGRTISASYGWEANRAAHVYYEAYAMDAEFDAARRPLTPRAGWNLDIVRNGESLGVAEVPYTRAEYRAGGFQHDLQDIFGRAIAVAVTVMLPKLYITGEAELGYGLRAVLSLPPFSFEHQPGHPCEACHERRAAVDAAAMARPDLEASLNN